jgi:hypothetical protein
MLIGFFAPNIIVFQPRVPFTTRKPVTQKGCFAFLISFRSIGNQPSPSVMAFSRLLRTIFVRTTMPSSLCQHCSPSCRFFMSTKSLSRKAQTVPATASSVHGIRLRLVFSVFTDSLLVDEARIENCGPLFAQRASDRVANIVIRAQLQCDERVSFVAG